MDSINPRAKNGPEYFIQNRWVDFLENKGWLVERLVGNAYQKGIPDLFVAHKQYCQRFLDIKVYGKYSFTKAQKSKWPVWENFGVGIWIIGAISPEACTKQHMIEEYKKLFQPPNWREFWNPKWDDKPNIEKLLKEVDDADSAMH